MVTVMVRVVGYCNICVVVVLGTVFVRVAFVIVVGVLCRGGSDIVGVAVVVVGMVGYWR